MLFTANKGLVFLWGREYDPVFCNEEARVLVLLHFLLTLSHGSFHSQSFHWVLIQLHHVSLNFSSIKHCYSWNKGKHQDKREGELGDTFLAEPQSTEMRPPQMRKTMPSDTMTWLSSCILLSAAWISAEEKGSSLSWLMDSVRRFMPTDCAWASWNTSKRATLNAFNLPKTGKKGEGGVNKLKCFQQDLCWDNSRCQYSSCPLIYPASAGFSKPSFLSLS